MLGFFRTAISVLFVSMVIWCALTVPLGRRTFADHVDRISQTREAEELITGARARVRPLLEEVKNRFLGEYVEAPTYLPSGAPGERPRRSEPAAKAKTRTADASGKTATPAGKTSPAAAKASPTAAKTSPSTKAPPAASTRAAEPASASKATPSAPATGESGSIYARGSGAAEPSLPGRRRRE